MRWRGLKTDARVLSAEGLVPGVMQMPTNSTTRTPVIAFFRFCVSFLEQRAGLNHCLVRLKECVFRGSGRLHHPGQRLRLYSVIPALGHGACPSTSVGILKIDKGISYSVIGNVSGFSRFDMIVTKHLRIVTLISQVSNIA